MGPSKNEQRKDISRAYKVVNKLTKPTYVLRMATGDTRPGGLSRAHKASLEILEIVKEIENGEF